MEEQEQFANQKREKLSNLIHKLIEEESLDKINVDINKTNSNKLIKFDRNNFLYEKAKIKNELAKILVNKNNHIREQEELSKCTFHPKINQNRSDLISNDMIKNSIYTRNVNWKTKTQEK